jgi:hypothetical protein
VYQYPEPVPAAETPRKRSFIRRHKFLTAFAGIAGLILIAVIAVSAAGSGSAPAPAPVPAWTFSGAPVATTAPAASPVATTAPAPVQSTPAMTGTEAQAVESAQGYLADGQGFSRAGLLQQLTSSYGEGFTTADAAFAVSYLHPDWDAQAVESAQGYMADGQGFSRAGLLQQLTSSYGEGFTQAQAEYAVAKVGL